MSMFHMKPSPTLIRRRAAGAVRDRIRRQIDIVALPLRSPDQGETALSFAEREFAIGRGLIRPFLGEQQ